MEHINTFPGLASVVLCHMSVTVNLTLIVENLLYGLFLLTLTVHSLFHRPFFHFFIPFYVGEALLLTSAKHTTT